MYALLYKMGKNVKAYLKEVGFTQKELAERIGLSRPTLDSYISMYEEGITIPKERYAIVFNDLFGTPNISAEEFRDRLTHLENLLNRDQNYGTSDLDTVAADYISMVITTMKKDMKRKDWDKDLYTFINLLITSYHDNTILKQFIEYFLVLNNVRDLADVKDWQKPYMANIFRTFRSINDNPNEYDEKDYMDFEKRCETIRSAKKRIANNIQVRIRALFDEYRKMGIDVSEEEIIEKISNQLIQEKRDGKL